MEQGRIIVVKLATGLAYVIIGGVIILVVNKLFTTGYVQKAVDKTAEGFGWVSTQIITVAEKGVNWLK